MEKLKDAYSDFSEIHGFDKLREKDQNQIKRAWEEEGKISEDDEPRSTAENKYVFYQIFLFTFCVRINWKYIISGHKKPFLLPIIMKRL